MPAKIQNCKNLCVHRRFAIVDSKRKPLREQAMKSKMFGMDAMKKHQTLDIEQDGVFK